MTATLGIYDTMQVIVPDVSTVCLGMAASGAAVLLAGGAPGKRLALPNARVLIHQPHGGAQGQSIDIENQAREIAFLRGRLEEILAHHTGQPRERIAADTDRDYILGAEDAVAYGLVDEVLRPRRLTVALPTLATGRRRPPRRPAGSRRSPVVAPARERRAHARVGPDQARMHAADRTRLPAWSTPGRGYGRHVSTGYQILVMLHLLCVIGGFGAVAYNALYPIWPSVVRGVSGASAVLEVNTLVSGLAELLIYAALLFGVGAVTASHSTLKFSQAWVSAAFAVYLVDIGILHGWIRRYQRRYAALARRMEDAAPAPGHQPAELRQLEGLGEAGRSSGGACSTCSWSGAVYLMVFKPGS